MIDELRATLTHQAQRVTPLPDPYVRLLRRRRRRRQTIGAVAAVLALAVALPSGWLLTRDARPQLAPALSPLVAQLLDSPVRGSLAGDTALLNQVLSRAASEEGSGQDSADLRVLFAGDVLDNQRLVLIAETGPQPQVVLYQGTGAASADLMHSVTTGDLDPVLNLSWNPSPDDPHAGYYLVLGPTGSEFQLGTDPRYLTDGTVRRIWSAVTGDYLIRAAGELPPRTRVRVSLTGTLLYEGGLYAAFAEPSGTGSIDPTPVDGGTPEPVVAQQAADVIAGTTGLTPATAHFQVLWSAEIPMAGLTDSRTAIIATVLARTSDGGGVYYTMCVDPADPLASARDHPTGGGVLGDPAHSLIAMRLPWYSGPGPTDQLQIVAPPTAIRAEAVRDGKVVTTGPLDRGAGQLRLPLPAKVTIRAYDEAGAVVAEYGFVDREGLRTDLFEPEIRVE